MTKTLEDFGAIGDGVTDNTVAIQAALDAPEPIYIQNKEYYHGGQVFLKRLKTVQGGGHAARLKSSLSVPAFVVQLGSDPIRTGGRVCDFHINNSAGEAYSFDLSTGVPTAAANFINRFVIDNMALTNGAGGYALSLNNPTNMDGYFCSTISNCMMYGGMNLPRLGDSVNILGNTVYGGGMGINITAVTGAANVVIEGNNFTPSNIAINIGAGAYNMRIENNTIEQVTAAPNGDFAILLWGAMNKVAVIGNNINGHNHLAGGAIGVGNGATDCIIDENIMNNSITKAYIHGSAVGTRIGKRNTGNAPAVSNSGVGTIFE